MKLNHKYTGMRVRPSYDKIKDTVETKPLKVRFPNQQQTLKFNGMRVRPTFDQIANYIETDPVKIRYPNREATFYLNSPFMQTLRQEGSIDLQGQSNNMLKTLIDQLKQKQDGMGGVVDKALSSAGGVVGSSMAGSVGGSSMAGTVSSASSMSVGGAPSSQGIQMLTQDNVMKMQKQAEERYIQEQQLVVRQAQERAAQVAKQAEGRQLTQQSLVIPQRHSIATAAAAASSSLGQLFTPEQINQFLEKRGSLLIPQPNPKEAPPIGISGPLTQLLEQIRRGSLLIPQSKQDVDIKYLKPEHQGDIVPSKKEEEEPGSPRTKVKKDVLKPEIEGASTGPKAKKPSSNNITDWDNYFSIYKYNKTRLYNVLHDHYNYTLAPTTLQKKSYIELLQYAALTIPLIGRNVDFTELGIKGPSQHMQEKAAAKSMKVEERKEKAKESATHVAKAIAKAYEADPVLPSSAKKAKASPKGSADYPPMSRG